MVMNDLLFIGFAEALSAPEVVWSLLDAGFRVAAFTSLKGRLPIESCPCIEIKRITAPEVSVERALSDLYEAYTVLGAAAIMPLNDKGVWFCDRLAADRPVVVLGPTGVQAQFSLDKRFQLKAAGEAGFNVPRTQVVECPEDIEKIGEYPVVVKSALAVAERDGLLLEKSSVSYCLNREELDSSLRNWDGEQPLLVQEIQTGIGEGLFGIAAGDDILAWSAHQRVRMMNPKGSGSSACRAVPVTDQPVGSTRSMMLQAQWHGMFMVEMLRDRAGKLWFVEVNGRSWGSMALALRMGFDYPAWSARLQLDPTFVPPVPAPREYLTCRHLGRELIHILQVLRGPKSRAIPNWPPFWRTCFDVLRVGKKDRWYNLRKGYTRFFLADTYNTVMNETIRKWIRF